MSQPAANESNRSVQTLDAVTRQLSDLKSRANRTSLLTFLMGAVALTLMTLYFSYGLRLLNEISEPEKLVSLGQQLLDDHLPQARASLQQQVVTQAPIWAEGLSRRAIDSVPMAREKLESFLMQQLDDSLERATLMSEEKFRAFLKTNHNELALSMTDLATSPNLAEERLVELQRAMEKEVQGDLQRTFRDASEGLTLVNQKLTRLRNTEGLSEGEQMERKVLVLVRLLQERQAPMPSTRLEPLPTAEGSATDSGGTKETDPATQLDPEKTELPSDPIAEGEPKAEP